MNKIKYYIKLYGIDGSYQGYASHVSVAKRKVESTTDMNKALSFSTQDAAYRLCDKICNVTKGCLKCSIHCVA